MSHQCFKFPEKIRHSDNFVNLLHLLFPKCLSSSSPQLLLSNVDLHSVLHDLLYERYDVSRRINKLDLCLFEVVI